MQKILLIKDLTRLPLEEKQSDLQINPSRIWQPFELVEGSNNWYLPIDAKEDLIKNNINFEEVEIKL